jgi:hypothetical protein
MTRGPDAGILQTGRVSSASKCNITRQKLLLYSAEYIRRYNYRNNSDIIWMRRILSLLENSYRLDGFLSLITLPGVKVT